MKLTVLFYGGSSYAFPEGNEVEHFNSIKEAKEEMISRKENQYRYPCLDPKMICSIGTLNDLTDIYPDFILKMNKNENVIKELT
tara:strand:+ start:334 stop:585 length:252 start_codon:yes stop_codon:yes gene_type:complete